MQKLFGTEIFSYKRFSYSLRLSFHLQQIQYLKNNIEPDLTFGCAQILSFNPSCPFLWPIVAHKAHLTMQHTISIAHPSLTMHRRQWMAVKQSSSAWPVESEATTADGETK